ncbi:MAG: hypothetical protein Kow00121_14270 [Elainellaceae cyanobacterium]
MLRILFIELLGGLGDVLIALPAIQALAMSHPQSHLTVLTFAPGGELLHHHPLIQQVIQIPKGTARQAVEQLLQQQTYDLILTDTTYDGIAELVQQSGAARVVTNLWRNPPPDQLVSDRFLHILHDEGLIGDAAAQLRHPQIYLTNTERSHAQTQLGAAYRPLICLYPDAGMGIKRWSIDRFVTLGRSLQQKYSATIIVPEGSNSSDVRVILDALEHARSWSRGSLRELAALFTQVDCLIAADTGPARIAAAIGVPTITLFGPSWHGRYGQPAPHINLQGVPDCPERNIANFTEQACWYSGDCPFEWDTCVDMISPETVLAEVDRVLKGVTGFNNFRTGVNVLRSPLAPLKKGGAEPFKAPLFQGDLGGSATARSTTQSPPKLGDLGGSQDLHIHTTLSNQLSQTKAWRSPQNILVMRLDNIGDVLMTSPALKTIKENNPDARLTLMASPAGAMTAPLLPWIDEVIPWRVLWQDLGRLAFDPDREWQLIHTLQAKQFDAAIIFTSFKQSPHPAGLVCQLAGIPLRLGESKETGGMLTHELVTAPDEWHQVERNLRLIESVGYSVRDRQLCLHVPTSTLIPDTPYLLLNPWTSCQSRTYCPERFAIAAKTLSDLTGYPVVVTGVEKDREQATVLLNFLGDRAIDLVGKTSLSDLVALIAQARLMLSNNTSTMHIADATQTPSVILFAGTELECQWQPRQTAAILLRRPTTCSPCYQFTCPYQLQCLDIEPDAVVAAGLNLLKRESPILPKID